MLFLPPPPKKLNRPTPPPSGAACRGEEKINLYTPALREEGRGKLTERQTYRQTDIVVHREVILPNYTSKNGVLDSKGEPFTFVVSVAVYCLMVEVASPA